MQNKGIVICVAVLLTLASIFYLSFSLDRKSTRLNSSHVR